MRIEFKEETPAGEVEFSGSLHKEEVDFLLRYALLSLLSRGLLPASVEAKFDDGDNPQEPPKRNLN